MLDPSKRFLTIILGLGIVALIAGIAAGERAGDRVIGQVTEKRLDSIAPITVTPAPQRSTSPYGPDWKRTDVMAAAPDPMFPDPRVPPQPLPTPEPTAKYRAATPPPLALPEATPTPNLNLPIWRRNAPLPTPTPTPVPGPSLQPNGEPVGEPSTQP
ncbi:MAG TPA: hypothetical protein VFA29_08025 [Candidatus Baltobacteraceae bacterium]|nr:hypothetical protein [Candidatus Baltobacteraceae bacterium]